MSLSQDQVKHIAKLARLKLTDEEVVIYTSQLSSVLDYMNVLNEVNTEKVEPTYQVTGLLNVFRKDEVSENEAKKEELLKCTNLPVEMDQIKVKSVF